MKLRRPIAKEVVIPPRSGRTRMVRVIPARQSDSSSNTTQTAVYPGSFDPVTLGHLDIMRRSSRLFDKVIVALSTASQTKHFSFTVEEREAMIRQVTGDLPNIEVVPFSGLLTRFTREAGATAIIRGLRALTDFDYEFQLASMNATLAPEIETVFLMTSTRYSYLSSSIVREIATLGGAIDHLVPKVVIPQILGRLGPRS